VVLLETSSSLEARGPQSAGTWYFPKESYGKYDPKSTYFVLTGVAFLNISSCVVSTSEPLNALPYYFEDIILSFHLRHTDLLKINNIIIVSKNIRFFFLYKNQ